MMTYPASPADAGASRLRPDPRQFWAGSAATAVVAALIALVGILISRWTLGIPILAPAGEGAWGNAHTGEYVLVAACVALVAAGLLYLLMVGTPQPSVFFHWIMGLATLAAVVYPFSTGAPLDQKIATAVVDLVLGVAIMSLLTAVAARAMRRPALPSQLSQPGRPGQPGQGAGYPPGRPGQPGQGAGYPPGRPGQPGQGAGYPPDQPGYDPTRPFDAPPQEPGPQPWP